MANEVEHLLMCLLATWTSSLEKRLFGSLCSFSNWVTYVLIVEPLKHHFIRVLRGRDGAACLVAKRREASGVCSLLCRLLALRRRQPLTSVKVRFSQGIGRDVTGAPVPLPSSLSPDGSDDLRLIDYRSKACRMVSCVVLRFFLRLLAGILLRRASVISCGLRVTLTSGHSGKAMTA